jgi:glucokinase
MQSIQLAGDIGGTKTTLAIIDPENKQPTFLDKATLPSTHYDSLEALVADYLKDKGWQLSQASFGVAGPVANGRAAITNLTWVIEESSLSRALNAPVGLFNDLVSIAQSVPHLAGADLETLNAGQPLAGGSIAVVAPGTGLGEAYLTWNDGRYHAYPSEGGHADFGPNGAQQVQLLTYLQARLGHVSPERVCSGLGIPNLYAFLRDSGAYPEPAWLAGQIAAAPDPTPVISQAAQAGSAEIATATFELFVDILGAEASNMALKVLSTAGVYLGGGIPPRILPLLKSGRFMRAFLNKGRFTEFLGKVPVHVICNPEAALIGAARLGLDGAKNW